MKFILKKLKSLFTEPEPTSAATTTKKFLILMTHLGVLQHLFLITTDTKQNFSFAFFILLQTIKCSYMNGSEQ